MKHVNEKIATGSSKTSGSPEDANVVGVNVADQDVAIAIVGEHRQEIDPAVEARVVRKIDMFLIPAMIVMYGLVYYDSE
jgi:hypothetical protein